MKSNVSDPDNELLNLDYAQKPNLKKTISTKLSLKGMTKERIHNQYEFGKSLGNGAFGSVKAARLWEDPTKIFAIKSLAREMFDKKMNSAQKKKEGIAEDEGDDPDVMIKLLETEIRVVMEMDHPNIVKFYQCVYDNDKVNIVMELVKGIPLSDLIIERGHLSEAESQIIAR